MHCMNCGASVPKEGKFCPSCGSSQADSEETSEDLKPKNTVGGANSGSAASNPQQSGKSFFWLLAILFAAGIGGFFVVSDMNERNAAAEREARNARADRIERQRASDAAERQRASDAAERQRAAEAAQRRASEPFCATVDVVVNGTKPGGAAWDFGDPAPEIEVSVGGSRLMSCRSSYSCSSNVFFSPNQTVSRSGQRFVELSIMDGDIQYDDLIGRGSCPLPTARCPVGSAVVRISPCG